MPAIADEEMVWPVIESTSIYRGAIIDVRRDTLEGDDGDSFEREVVHHKGAVVVVAVDEEDRVLVIRQYRNPARQRLVELPAGLLDVEGEEPLVAAQRELAEEGQIVAEKWSPLLTLMPSPGVSDEVISVYLAEDVKHHAVPDGFVAQHEESQMTREWVPLGDLVDAVLAGRVKNGSLVAGVLAVWAGRRRGR